MKSAVFERQQGQLTAALETISIALSKFPNFAKLYMIQGQIYQSQKSNSAARASYAAGIKACPKETTLWILAARLEEADDRSIKARALLEKARLLNPGNDALRLGWKNGQAALRKPRLCSHGACKSAPNPAYPGPCRSGLSHDRCANHDR
jgi:tetratricopeptide (TPR) repeat protein